MTADNSAATETDLPPVFAAIITPHRSLGATGFLILMAVFGTASFAAGMAFLLMGAWPVLGFFGLDVLLLYIAFRVNYGRAAAFEEITVTTSELVLREVSHRGRVSEWRANPLWVRLEQESHEEFGIEQLFLVSRGVRRPVASFLGPDEKSSFAKALLRALASARRGPNYASAGQDSGGGA